MADQKTKGKEGVREVCISHQRLMRESTDCVESALRSEDPIERLVASRVLESPVMFQSWENEHSGLMKDVANSGFRRTQAALLKKTSFRLIHRKALFEYLRDEQVRGPARHHVIASFHPTRDYARSVIAEHEVYLRKACSFLCASHVGGHVVHDSGFFDPMRHYQRLYAEYFKIFCDAQLSQGSAEDGSQMELLPLLKFQLDECRKAIMNPEFRSEWHRRETELREPTGDTTRLPRLDRSK